MGIVIKTGTRSWADLSKRGRAHGQTYQSGSERTDRRTDLPIQQRAAGLDILSISHPIPLRPNRFFAALSVSNVSQIKMAVLERRIRGEEKGTERKKGRQHPFTRRSELAYNGN